MRWRRQARLAAPLGDETAAAVVDFVLVGSIVTVLFAAIAQLALTLHVRNTLIASAAEGARYAANADLVPAAGAEQARQVIREALADRFATDVTAGYETVEGLTTVYVEVHAPLPLFGPLGPPDSLVVRGHALAELAP
jgi:hypothetical protein